MVAPERALIGHPVNPAHLLPVVEICGGEDSPRALVERLEEGLSAIGCEVGPSPGSRQHILTFTHPRVAPDSLEEGMARENIVVSVRRGTVRAATLGVVRGSPAG